MIHTGDCREVMAAMEPESVDAIVTDPPYGLEFMDKDWDRGVPGAEFWTAMLRVARPSSYLLAFGGTRTVHRMATAIEDAGWVIRDMLVWAYASGFPKSKASLKPAWEPIVMARKPGPLRNLNIDACRIGMEGGTRGSNYAKTGLFGIGGKADIEQLDSGRWPANLILTDPIFDGDTPGVVGGGISDGMGRVDVLRRGITTGAGMGYGSSAPAEARETGYGDSGTYSRFFLVPKADRSDRESVLGGLPEHDVPNYQPTVLVCQCGERWKPPENGGLLRCNHPREMYHYEAAPLNARKRANVHPTVKPTELMRHLVRLVTPAGGIVLDPFLGSGTTGLAAEMEGFEWIGIEREPEYVAIAEARLLGTQRGLGLAEPAAVPLFSPPTAVPTADQLALEDVS